MILLLYCTYSVILPLSSTHSVILPLSCTHSVIFPSNSVILPLSCTILCCCHLSRTHYVIFPLSCTIIYSFKELMFTFCPVAICTILCCCHYLVQSCVVAPSHYDVLMLSGHFLVQNLSAFGGSTAFHKLVLLVSVVYLKCMTTNLPINPAEYRPYWAEPRNEVHSNFYYTKRILGRMSFIK